MSTSNGEAIAELTIQRMALEAERQAHLGTKATLRIVSDSRNELESLVTSLSRSLLCGTSPAEILGAVERIRHENALLTHRAGHPDEDERESQRRTKRDLEKALTELDSLIEDRDELREDVSRLGSVDAELALKRADLLSDRGDIARLGQVCGELREVVTRLTVELDGERGAHELARKNLRTAWAQIDRLENCDDHPGGMVADQEALERAQRDLSDCRAGLLANEHADDLAVEREAHARTRMNLDAAGKMLIPAHMDLANAVNENAELRRKVAALTEERDELLEEMAKSASPESVATAVGSLHDSDNYEFDEDPDDEAADGDVFLAAVESLRTVVVTSSRDWSSTRGDAWIYGLVVGWCDAEILELSRKFRWGAETVERLKQLHDEYLVFATREGTGS